MQKLFQNIISIGIKKHYSPDQKEKTKLVNGISLLGVPVSLLYFILFGATGYYFISIVFFVGAIVFSLTLLFNKLFGLNFARIYISVFAPLCFGYVNFISGKDAGFYMGFIATTMPALIIFDKSKQSFLFIGISIFILILSSIGQMYIPAVENIKFVMVIMVINLFTVLMATLTVVYLFKKELNESKANIEEKQKEILDSINYAKRIQQAILPNSKFITKTIKRLKNK